MCNCVIPRNCITTLVFLYIFANISSFNSESGTKPCPQSRTLRLSKPTKPGALTALISRAYSTYLQPYSHFIFSKYLESKIQLQRDSWFTSGTSAYGLLLTFRAQLMAAVRTSRNDPTCQMTKQNETVNTWHFSVQVGNCTAAQGQLPWRQHWLDGCAIHWNSKCGGTSLLLWSQQLLFPVYKGASDQGQKEIQSLFHKAWNSGIALVT